MCLFGSVNRGPRTAVAGVNVVGEYCSVPCLIFASLSFPAIFLGLRSFRFLGLQSLFSRHPDDRCQTQVVSFSY